MKHHKHKVRLFTFQDSRAKIMRFDDFLIDSFSDCLQFIFTNSYHTAKVYDPDGKLVHVAQTEKYDAESYAAAA